MSDSLFSQLKSKRLTNIDRYRRLQHTFSGGGTEDQASGAGQEDWKNWQLVPVTAGRETDDPTLLDPGSEAAQGLYKAIDVLDKK